MRQGSSWSRRGARPAEMHLDTGRLTAVSQSGLSPERRCEGGKVTRMSMRRRLVPALGAILLMGAAVLVVAQAALAENLCVGNRPGCFSTAGGLDLRASLSGSFSSVELGAPPSVRVGVNPSGVAVSKATHTVYVVNQNSDTVSVIDVRACNAGHPAGCDHPSATITLGPSGSMNGPVSAVVSPDGRTLYVTSPGGANAVAVIDASTCNAIRMSGCAHRPGRASCHGTDARGPGGGSG